MLKKLLKKFNNMTLGDYEKYIKSNLQQKPIGLSGTNQSINRGATGYSGWLQAQRGLTGTSGQKGATGSPGIIDYSIKNRELILKEAMQMFNITDEDLKSAPSSILSKIREYKINKITE